MPFVAAVTPPAPSPFQQSAGRHLGLEVAHLLAAVGQIARRVQRGQVAAAAGTVLSALFPILARSLLVRFRAGV